MSVQRSDRNCAVCGRGMWLKTFRGAQIHVCQSCNTVTLTKADFTHLLVEPEPEELAPAPMSVSYAADAPGISLPPAEEHTEEFTSPLVNDFAPTEIATEQFDGPSWEMPADATESGHEPSFAMPADSAPQTGPRFDPTAVSIPTGPRGPDMGTGGPPPDDFDAELREYQSTKARRSQMMIAGAAGLLALVLVVATITAAVGWTLNQGYPQEAASGDPTPEDPVPSLPVGPAPAAPVSPGPAAPPLPVPPTPPPVTPAPVAPAPAPVAPAPAPVAPTPAPVAPAPPANDFASVVRRGWKAFDRSAKEAEDLFARALEERPADADANYGYGYALLQQGRNSESASYLCRASKSGSAEIQRETKALIDRNGLACN